jgi:glycosyltransferase involved in cell wall biosynthesis
MEAGGKVVAPDDVAGIKAAIEEYVVQFERGQLSGPSAEVVKKYSRLTLTGQLVKIFEALFEP